MRLMPVNLTEDDLRIVAHYAKTYHWNDLNFLADLYALILLNGKGLPTVERVTKLATVVAELLKQPPQTTEVLLLQRRALLSKLMDSLPLAFYRSQPETQGKPLEVVRLVLDHYFSLSLKTQKATCLVCPLYKDCAFGHKYATQVAEISWVVDPEWKTLLHEDCPHQPELEQVNLLAAALEEEERLFEENALELAATNIAEGHFQDHSAPDTALYRIVRNLNFIQRHPADEHSATTPDSLKIGPGPANFPGYYEYASQAVNLVPDYSVHGGGGVYGDSHLGLQYRGAVDAVDKLTAKQLALFDMAQRLGTTLAKKGHGKFQPSTAPTGHNTVERLSSAAQLRRQVPSEHIRSDQEHMARIASNQVLYRQPQEPHKKRCLWYLILDTSASMTSRVTSDGNSVWGQCARATLALIFTQAICKLAKQEDGMVWLRPFALGVGDMRFAQTKVQFTQLEQYLASLSFDGGGTDLASAIRTATEDVAQHTSEIRKAQLLVLTDCGTDKYSLIQPITNLLAGGTRFAVLNCLEFTEEEEQSAKRRRRGGANAVNRQIWETVAYLRQTAERYFQVSSGADFVKELTNLVIT